MRTSKKYLCLAVTAGAIVAAALPGSPALAGSTSIGVVKSFHSNAGGGTTATVSNHGNVVDYLSPDSPGAGRYEHMGVGAIGEGYVLCYTGPSGQVNTFDTGASESGFGPSTFVSQTATTYVTRRNTSDNRLTLTQKVNFVGANREVQVSMTLRNNTGSPIPGVILRRQVDFDVDTGGADGWAGFQSNHSSTTRTSAFAWNDPSTAPADKEAHAMQLRFVSADSTFIHRAYTTGQILDNTCNTDSKLTSGGPYFGDFGDTIQFNIGPIPTGATRNVTIAYARF